MKPLKIVVKTNLERYPIYIGSNLILKLKNLLKKNNIKFERCLLIIDKNVPISEIKKIKKNLQNKKIFTYYFISNEINKNQKNVNLITKILLKENFSRQDCLISIGGGITGDVSGYAASIFKRGMQFINIPTTLLSQVDSSIGGKTGINTSYGKNLLGSFYQPKLVISDYNFLKTLPKREIICGYGEILKHAIISNKKLFFYLDRNFYKIINLDEVFIEKAIFESCKIKKSIIEKDEKEKNLRKILNFGHTFAHAFEATTNYSKKLNHGEAVLIGMLTALKFSNKIRILNKKDYKLVLDHFKKIKVNSNIKNFFSLKDLKKLVFFMIKDKKNISQKINLILLRKIGNTVLNRKFNQNTIKLFLKKELGNYNL